MSSAKVSITIEIDPVALSGYTDQQLASAWHVAQANPADGFASKEPGEIVERIGREIIRRFLGATAPELYHHQGSHHYWKELADHGKWIDGVYTPNGEASDTQAVRCDCQ